MAVLNYESAFACFPPNQIRMNYPDKSKIRGWSLFVQILPQIDQAPLFDQWDFAEPVDPFLPSQQIPGHSSHLI
ncbi:DUF1559 domain-containing protein [Gimesia chilikensis]|uniref:DUF1559 family PulG-like putative transporter n=1 Tax=Gimesia chilikensis TaxID=2605989 RepID=UPI001E61424E|nr:DUF1559 domain-containing protein [Gimesia chilikensis]